MKLRFSVKCLAAAALAVAVTAPTFAQEPVRIGYAIARTGPWAAGAQVTQEPNYIMWAEQLNASGGLNVKGVKRKIELIGIDDRSDTETVVRSYEKLMGSDKVDLILPPWSTGANFAMMPLAQKYGYPILAPTATGRKLLGMKNPYFFALLQQPDRMMDSLAEYMAARSAKTAAVLYVDELFGLEQLDGLERALKAKNIQIVEKKSYPLGVKDLQPALNDVKAKNPDAFVALSYPPDTFLITGQSRAIGFNPKLFYLAVGTAFPVYRDKFGKVAEGVMGLGTWNPRTSPAAKALLRRAREAMAEGARPLGERARVGRAADPAGRGGEGRARSQGDPRLHREQRVRHDHRQDPVQERRERHHAGRRQPVAGRRVRGGVAAGPLHQPGALSEAGLVSGRASMNGSAGRPRSRFCLRLR